MVNVIDFFLTFHLFDLGEAVHMVDFLNFYEFSTPQPGGGRVQIVEFIDLFDFLTFLPGGGSKLSISLTFFDYFDLIDLGGGLNSLIN